MRNTKKYVFTIIFSHINHNYHKSNIKQIILLNSWPRYNLIKYINYNHKSERMNENYLVML